MAKRLLLRTQDCNRTLQQSLGEIGFRNEEIQNSCFREMNIGDLVIPYLKQVLVTGKISIDSI